MTREDLWQYAMCMAALASFGLAMFLTAKAVIESNGF